jgi:hypothetical protein
LRQEYENQTRSNGEIEHQCTVSSPPSQILSSSCAELTIPSSVVAGR